MAKEYIIDNQKYVFSKSCFQKAILEKHGDLKRSLQNNRYNMTDLYEDMGYEINVSSETIRKWYSKASATSPADVTTIELIAKYLGVQNIFSLLEEVKEMPMPENFESDRQLVKDIYCAMLDFVEDSFDDSFGANNTYRAECSERIRNIHDKIYKAAFEIKPITAEKLHQILLQFLDDLTQYDVPAQWDAVASPRYYDAKWYYGDRKMPEYGTQDFEDEELATYFKEIYPPVYEDDDAYVEMPFDYKYVYKREFAITLQNVFRNEFPEYFLF